MQNSQWPQPPEGHLLPDSSSWEAVKGYILGKNQCFDFTWLNNKSSRERKEAKQARNKARSASPDAGRLYPAAGGIS